MDETENPNKHINPLNVTDAFDALLEDDDESIDREATEKKFMGDVLKTPDIKPRDHNEKITDEVQLAADRILASIEEEEKNKKG